MAFLELWKGFTSCSLREAGSQLPNIEFLFSCAFVSLLQTPRGPGIKDVLPDNFFLFTLFYGRHSDPPRADPT